MRKLFKFSISVSSLLIVACIPAGARWKGEYAGASPEARAWFYSQRLSTEAQRRLGLGFSSCCDAGDVYPRRFRVVNDGSKYGHEEWQYERGGEWLSIPSDIIEHTETPTGQPVLFLFPYDGMPNVKKGTPVCFKLPPTKG